MTGPRIQIPPPPPQPQQPQNFLSWLQQQQMPAQQEIPEVNAPAHLPDIMRKAMAAITSVAMPPNPASKGVYDYLQGEKERTKNLTPQQFAEEQAMNALPMLSIENAAAKPFAQLLYSRLDNAIKDGPLKTTAKKWLDLLKQSTLSEEISYRGFKNFLEQNSQRSLTKDEMQQFADANKIQLGEWRDPSKWEGYTARLDGGMHGRYQPITDDPNVPAYGNIVTTLEGVPIPQKITDPSGWADTKVEYTKKAKGLYNKMQQEIRNMFDQQNDISDAGRKQYKKMFAADPNRSNLWTWSQEPRLPNLNEYMDTHVNPQVDILRNRINRMRERATKVGRASWGDGPVDVASYVHKGHYPEAVNNLFHTRGRLIKGPDGERIFHLDEAQSDLHQAAQGKDGGYADVKLGERGKHGETKDLPRAPFETNWIPMQIRRTLDEAARANADWVSLTSGKQAKDAVNFKGGAQHYDKNMTNSLIKELKALGIDNPEIRYVDNMFKDYSDPWKAAIFEVSDGKGVPIPPKIVDNHIIDKEIGEHIQEQVLEFRKIAPKNFIVGIKNPEYKQHIREQLSDKIDDFTSQMPEFSPNVIWKQGDHVGLQKEITNRVNTALKNYLETDILPVQKNMQVRLTPELKHKILNEGQRMFALNPFAGLAGLGGLEALRNKDEKKKK